MLSSCDFADFLSNLLYQTLLMARPVFLETLLEHEVETQPSLGPLFNGVPSSASTGTREDKRAQHQRSCSCLWWSENATQCGYVLWWSFYHGYFIWLDSYLELVEFAWVQRVHQHVKMGVRVSFSVPKQEHHPLWSVTFLETVFGVVAHVLVRDRLGISVEKLRIL